MARHLRIPLLADIIRTDAPAEIVALADDPLLDRGFGERGPLLNRILARRVRGVLVSRGTVLPSGRMRDDPKRREAVDALAERLSRNPQAAVGELGPAVDAAADHVAGRSERPAGELAQELFGRLFRDDFRASPETWEAAETLRRSLQGRNPLSRLRDSLSAAVPRALGRLSAAMEGDPTGVHAIGIAAQNMARTLEGLRALYAAEAEPGTVGPAEAVARCLVAPRAVLRQAVGPGETVGGDTRRGTLVMLEVGRGHLRSLDPRIAFLSEAWSGCPAHAFVPALVAEIWRRAAGTTGSRQEDAA